MELHGIEPELSRKELTCTDCGHVFLVAREQRSGTCTKCGNVVDMAVGSLSALAGEITKRVLPKLRDADPLEAFRTAPDGQRVEELRIQLQVEWQLWAAVVRNFRDPVHHMAYLTTAIARNELELAAARYREHRSVMALLDDSRWQAQVADLMLARIEAIAASRLEPRRWRDDLQARFWAFSADSRVMKVAWVAVGMAVLLKLVAWAGKA